MVEYILREKSFQFFSKTIKNVNSLYFDMHKSIWTKRHPMRDSNPRPPD